MAFQAPILTTAALNAINEVLAGGHVLAVVSSQFGNGFPAPSDVPANYTALVSPKAPGKNTSANDLTLYQTSIRTEISSADISTAFQINEIGVYATLDAGAPFLYAYMTTGAATGDTLTPSSPANAVIKAYAIVIKYTTNVPVSTTITLSEQIQLHASTHLGDGVDPIPPASSGNTGIVPKTNNVASQVLTGGATAAWAPVPIAATGNPGGGPSSPADPTQMLLGASPALWGPVPLVTPANKGGLPVTPAKAFYVPQTDASGNVSWAPQTPMLNVSTTLYVKAGNSDIAPNFSTLQNALNYLSQYVFAPGISILINVSSGNYQNSSAIYIDHVNASQITIQGVNAVGNLDNDVTYTGIGSISGSSGNWNVQLTGCNSTAAVTVGGYILAYSAAGIATDGNALVCGFFKVMAVTATTVTVQIPWRRPNWPSMAGFYAGNFTPINCIFTATGPNQSGWSIGQHGLGAVRNLGIVATGTQSNNYWYHGLSASGPTNFNRVGVYGFNNNQYTNAGFALGNATFNLQNCAGTNNSGGLVIFAGSVGLYSCAFTHNGIIGIGGGNGANITAAHGYTWSAGNGYVYQGYGSGIGMGGALLTTQGDPNNNNYWAGLLWVTLNAYQGTVFQSKAQYYATSSQDAMIIRNSGQLGVAGTGYDVVCVTGSLVQASYIQGSRIFNLAVNTLSSDGSLITQ